MAKSDAIWGIDIGQSALKALRCRPHDEATRLVADAFDYVEYPKILSQPEADAVQLVKEALTEFLSRNRVRGDRVAVSVAGQAGLARFIKLPPVESKKIPDIVKYEARQQIPFPLEDVVWDYQQMPGGSEADGFALETEVGLFAMKRDQVLRALKPFADAGIEVDLLQLTPLALYNMIVFDQMPDLPPPELYDPSDPPPSVVLLSMGTDTTDLVVTNGYRVWQRSIPLGGNHFTKALTKELKLTFAKAEQTKRNAAQHENPKVLFQAMRPVFTDLATEMDRSLKYFGTIDRTAKLTKIIGLGNVMKLPGLQRFLQQHLGLEVVKLENFGRLSGTAVVDAPAFKQNLLAFSTAYGLCLQGLRETKIRTNLIPPEVLKDRSIRAKKPWAVAAAAALLLGMSANYLGGWGQYRSAAPQKFEAAVTAADRVAGDVGKFKSDFDAAKSSFNATKDLGRQLVLDNDARTSWLRVLRAINVSLPRDVGEQPALIGQRMQLHITSIDATEYEDVATWFSSERVAGAWRNMQEETAKAAAPTGAAPEGAEPAADSSTEGSSQSGPTGTGWVFRLRGFHFHNKLDEPQNSAHLFVIQTLIHNLRQPRIVSPGSPPDGDPVAELGISFPVIIHDGRVNTDAPAAGLVDGLGLPVDAKKEGIEGAFLFSVEFCWQPKPKDGATPGGADGSSAEAAGN